MYASVFAARVTAPTCLDESSWQGHFGTCLDYERLGLCHDGGYSSEPFAKNGHEEDARSDCCACGLRGLRESCYSYDVIDSVPQAATLFAAAHLVLRHTALLRGFPSEFALDSVERGARNLMLETAEVLVEFMQSWVASLHRLLYLLICARVCDARLPQVNEFRKAKGRLLRAIGYADSPHLQLNVTLVREACRRISSVDWMITYLNHLAHGAEMLIDQTSATLLNFYFTRGSRSRFVLNTGFRIESRRWGVVRTLLEALGCKTRRCDIVEVGVFAAETSEHLLQELPLLYLHGVDPYADSDAEATYTAAKQVFSRFADRATLHRNVSDQVASIVGSVDLAFLDGNHNYSAVLSDVKVWATKVRWLCGHDLNLANVGVARALYDWSSDDVEIQVLPDGMWLVKLEGGII